MQASARQLTHAEVPVEMFIDACKQVVKANEQWLAPYGTGATLYLRPFLIGVGDNIGVHPAPEYIFSIFCCPVGAYFKGGMSQLIFIVSEYDRAAPHGTGAAKVGGNYATSLYPGLIAKTRHFGDCIYLDPATYKN